MSRFVTAGGDEAKRPSDPAREDAWAKAQAQIEAARAKPKTQDGKQEGGKSLYEVLQANKGTPNAAEKEQKFEEANRLRNQFRALDDDEVGFLDSVEETARQKEAAARRETAEELESFRKQQQEVERRINISSAKEDQASADPPNTNWQTKKRRRKEPATTSTKVRKTTTNQSPEPSDKPAIEKPKDDDSGSKVNNKNREVPPIAPSNGLGLGAYDDSDND